LGLLDVSTTVYLEALVPYFSRYILYAVAIDHLCFLRKANGINKRSSKASCLSRPPSQKLRRSKCKVRQGKGWQGKSSLPLIFFFPAWTLHMRCRCSMRGKKRAGHGPRPKPGKKHTKVKEPRNANTQYYLKM
jgi:hypothetical protein